MIARALRLYRIENDLSLAQVAERVGVSVETVRRAEAGRSVNDRTEYKLWKYLYEAGALAPEKVAVA